MAAVKNQTVHQTATVQCTTPLSFPSYCMPQKPGP